jgi:glyoxylate utilization-related uncharacterized protein
VARADETYEGRAAYDLKPRSAVELELHAGDLLYVFRTFSPEWVYAENKGAAQAWVWFGLVWFGLVWFGWR